MTEPQPQTPIKPPFSYYGGKQRLAPKIINLLPPHMVYVEPYAGSAAVMFRKGLPVFTDNDHYIEVLNDLNGEVINFFRVMQDPALRIALIDRLVWTPHHEEEHRLAQERTGDSPVDRAWDFYIDLQLSFARSMGHRFAISKAKGKSSVFRNAIDGLGLFRELYPEQYNNLLVLAAGAATNVEQTQQPGNDKLAQAVTIVLKAAYDIVDMFANFPEFVDKFVKDTLIPQLVQRAFDLLKYTGVLQAAPTVLPA